MFALEMAPGTWWCLMKVAGMGMRTKIQPRRSFSAEELMRTGTKATEGLAELMAAS